MWICMRCIYIFWIVSSWSGKHKTGSVVFLRFVSSRMWNWICERRKKMYVQRARDWRTKRELKSNDEMRNGHRAMRVVHTPLTYYDYYATVWFNSPFKQDIKRSSFVVEYAHRGTHRHIAELVLFLRRSGTRFNRFACFDRIQNNCFNVYALFRNMRTFCPFECVGERKQNSDATPDKFIKINGKFLLSMDWLKVFYVLRNLAIPLYRPGHMLARFHRYA